MKYKVVFCVTIFLLMISTVIPQSNKTEFAFGSGNGILIFMGFQPASTLLSSSGVTAYKLERRVVGKTEWVMIGGRLNAPESIEDFIIRLNEVAKNSSDPDVINHIPADKIWNKLIETKKIDSVAGWLSIIAVQRALGTAYLDLDVLQNISYEYRVSSIGKDGKIIEVRESSPVSFPLKVEFPTYSIIYERYNSNIASIKWGGVNRPKPNSFKAFRAIFGESGFEEMKALRIIYSTNDSVFFSVTDTNIAENKFYKYFIIPMDYLGNFGFPSDTAEINASSFRNARIVELKSVESSDSIVGLILKWKNYSSESIKLLRLFRSEKWDSDYKLIAELSPNESQYIDPMIEPMRMYFYQMVMVGWYDEVSPPSARVSGIYTSLQPPLAPEFENIKIHSNGIEFDIFCEDYNINCFRIYKSSLYSKEFELSSTVLATDNRVHFIDTSQFFSPKEFYFYAVKSENTSRLMSDFSDTISFRPNKQTNPPTPINLNVENEEGNALLRWDDMTLVDKNIQGYILYRKRLDNKGKEASYFPICEELISSKRISYLDTTVSCGIKYEYSIKSVDDFGGVSGFSSPALLFIPFEKISPPSALRIAKFKNGVKISWDYPSEKDMKCFRIYRKDNKGKYILLKETEFSEDSYLDKTATKDNIRYSYCISVVDNSGVESVKSEEISIK